LRLRERRRHARLVDFIRAWEWNGYAHERQAGRLELGGENLLTHPMHAHPAERLGDGRQRAHDLAVAGATRLMQRPGAVLAARPGDQRLWAHALAGRRTA